MQILYLILGLIAGIFSGSLGIGGGIIMVPSMVLFFGLTQHQAQGTSLAVMLPPVFFFAVWRYYSHGHVNIPMAIFTSIGLIVGAYLGANLIQGVSEVALKRAFGILLIFVGIKMVFFR